MKAKMLASVVGALLMAGATTALADSSDPTDANDTNTGAIPSDSNTNVNPNTNPTNTNPGDLPQSDQSAGQGMSGTQQQPSQQEAQPGTQAPMKQENMKNAHAESAKGYLMTSDASAHTLTLTIPAGKTTTIEKAGSVTSIDQTKHLITLQLPVSDTAKVRRNGKASSLDALQPGDEVRVRYDPKANAITRITATPSKGHAKMNKGNMQNEQPSGNPNMNEQPSGNQNTNPGTQQQNPGDTNAPENTNPTP